MKYIIMCGGKYNGFTTPKQFSEINGEKLIERTIRLLKENGITNIAISSNDKRFYQFNVAVLKNQKNNFVQNKQGYWLDAFYPSKTPCTYLYGDVYYSEAAIKTIVEKAKETEGTKENILCGTSIAKNKLHKNWGEPFAYIVNDTKTFQDGIIEVKKMQDEGKLLRVAITWELYRYLNNFDVNVQNINDDTYICIDDETDDIDSIESVNKLQEKINSKE